MPARSQTPSSQMEEELNLAQNEYVIERIVEKKMVKNKVMYLCKWKNWDDKDNTWEPVDNLSTCPELIDEFNKKSKGFNQKRTEESIMQGKKPELKKKTPSGSLSNEANQHDQKRPSRIKRNNDKIKQRTKQKLKMAKEIKDKIIPKNRAQNIKFQQIPKNMPTSIRNNDFYETEEDDVIERINYHQYVNQMLHYSVDCYSKDGKVLGSFLKTSQQLKRRVPIMLIKYIQGFIIQVQQYNNDRKMAHKNVDTNTERMNE